MGEVHPALTSSYVNTTPVRTRPTPLSTYKGFPRSCICAPTKVPFNLVVPPKSKINLGVCTGLGDILWVYQQFAPYFEKIEFTVYSTRGSEVGMRSMEWLKLMPQCVGGKFYVIPSKDYNDLAGRACTLQDTVYSWMQNPQGIINHSCNKWLEEGVRLDEIDPNAVVDTQVNLKMQPFHLPRDGPYAVLYVSGDTRHGHLHNNGVESIWSVGQWVDYVTKLWEKWNLKLPVVCLGAKYDELVTFALYENLRMKGIDAGLMVGQDPEKVVYLISKCDLYIGYQSGLSVVADLLETKKNVMLWFPRLDRMLYSFQKRGHEGTRYFPSLFSQTPEEVVSEHMLWKTH